MSSDGDTHEVANNHSNLNNNSTNNEKTPDAESNLPPPPQKPPGGPPPNGGLTAWLQVLGGFFLFFNTWVCCDFQYYHS